MPRAGALPQRGRRAHQMPRKDLFGRLFQQRLRAGETAYRPGPQARALAAMDRIAAPDGTLERVDIALSPQGVEMRLERREAPFGDRRSHVRHKLLIFQYILSLPNHLGRTC